MRSQIKLGDHTVESTVLLKGIGLGIAIAAGVLGWMWKKRQSRSLYIRTHSNDNHHVFKKMGRRWPQAMPVK
ncbi:hypothetical protein [Chitinophaga sp.]|uniref:hypothetical protein n=1 Tax=Chitinophaga sp. TaxID=1869181 RepID=UPI002DBFE73D|nr:hypothetical protein [Chitinophaga sp.]